MTRQRHRGGALEDRKNSSSKRIVLVQRDNNKVLVDKNSRNTSYESRSKTPGTSGNRQHIGERSHMSNQSFKRGILEQCVPSREEGQEKPSCNQLQAPVSIHTIPALQNGRLALCERNVAEGRFHV